MAAHAMDHLDAREFPGMLGSALPAQFDFICGHTLALLAELADDIHPLAASERGQQHLDRIGRDHRGTAVEQCGLSAAHTRVESQAPALEGLEAEDRRTGHGNLLERSGMWQVYSEPRSEPNVRTVEPD